MDIDSLVLKMTAASRLKVTKQEQSLQKLEWKQSAYQSVTKALMEFRDKYFNSLSATNFKSSSLYNIIRASVPEDTKAFTATATSTATAGKAVVNKISQLATSETITNAGTVSKPLTTAVKFNNLDSLVSQVNGQPKDFMVSLDGVSRTVVMDDAFVTDLKRIAVSDSNGSQYIQNADSDQIAAVDLSLITNRGEQAEYLQEALQNRIDTLFGGATGTTASTMQPIEVTANPRQNNSNVIDLSFTAREGSKLTLGYATKETVNLKRGETENIDDYAARVEAAEAIAHNVTGLGQLGFTDKQSNRLDVYSSIADLAGKINGGFVPFGLDSNGNQYVYKDPNYNNQIRELTDGAFKFVINDVKFSIDPGESLYSVMNKINSSTAGVTLSYSEVTDKFTLTAKQAGTGESIVMGDTNRNLLAALGLQKNDINIGIKDKTTSQITMTDLSGGPWMVYSTNPVKTPGENAVVYIDGEKIERPSNEFTVNGVAYSLKELYDNSGWTPNIVNGKVTNATSGKTVTLAADATDLTETVKNFVKDYNALVDLLHGMTNEEAFSDYEPLTEEQRAAMSESQIKLWEEKAKSGILLNDSAVNKILSSMRESFLSSVDGFWLGDMGITYGTTTDSWKSYGKLTISDEAKLKSTLESQPDRVRDFFTNASKGVATKIDKVLDNAVRTTGGSGNRGSLIEIAGWPSTLSETENSLYTQMLNHSKRITSLKEQLEKEESRLWAQFTAMEEALSKLNEQQSYLTQYLGQQSS
jgi:flagellar hook-associated protein 2